MPIESDDEIRELLSRARSFAVVGIRAGVGASARSAGAASPGRAESIEPDAFRVPAYLQQQGYRIVPVSPKLTRVLGERALASLREIREPIDLVDLFRAPQHIPAHADEILAMSPLPRAVWLQLGIRHDEAARRLEAAGIGVVQDRCIMVDHRRLLGTR
jgi:predicted CoA-binding protein